ncbi:MAG: cytochrome c family protein [Cyclobacteriaceae bacterium]|nr:cytochrome c family protein [Cyclobacteriaceae bacterium]
MRNKFLILSIIIFVLALLYVIYNNISEENILPLTNSWEKAIPNQEIPQGLSSLSAKQCGVCHQQHYNEWKLSTHAHAWTDLQFQAELKKESSPFMCINCHIPLQNQQEHIIEGLIDGDIYKPVKKINPNFDKELQQEGINCASCHVRNNTIIGPTGTKKAPHATIKNSAFLSEQLCISCHNAVAVITPTLACSFETGDEWKSGPYFEKKNCISCHMESINREIVSGYGERSSRLHYFAGSGIPKFDTVETKIMNGLGIYPSALKSIYSKMDSIIFTVKIKNEFAGHNVPTGDPERFFNISFQLKNNNGTILSTKTSRIGEHWEWYPEAKKLADNNLTPNEERLFTFSYQAIKKGSLTLLVKITKHRLNKESADYNNLKDNYPLFITVFDEEYAIEVK